MPDDQGTSDPKAFLFCSFDIQGSTKIKTVFDLWASIQFVFYRELEGLFRDSKIESGRKTFKRWKSLGDEVVYFMEIDSLEDLESMTSLLYSVAVSIDCKIQSYSEALMFTLTEPEFSSSADPKLIEEIASTTLLPGAMNRAAPLAVKSAAWISVCRTYHEGIHDSKGYDLLLPEFSEIIGPHMDEGFRVANEAQPGSVVMTVELAIALLKACTNEFSQKLWLKKDRVKFKGVWHDAEYPIVYMRMLPSELNRMSAERRRESMQKFCDVLGLQPIGSVEMEILLQALRQAKLRLGSIVLRHFGIRYS
jgi:hypothetical protein